MSKQIKRQLPLVDAFFSQDSLDFLESEPILVSWAERFKPALDFFEADFLDLSSFSSSEYESKSSSDASSSESESDES